MSFWIQWEIYEGVSGNEELVCVDMSEADEEKPKHCNLASMLYDLGLLFPIRNISRTTVLSYMKHHNTWLLKTSSKKSDSGSR